MMRSHATAVRAVPQKRAAPCDEDSPPSLARLYLEMADRHRRRGDDPKLIAALVRAAWRLRFGG